MTGMSGERLPTSVLLPSATVGHAASQLKTPSTRLPQLDHHYIDINPRPEERTILDDSPQRLSRSSHPYHQT